MKIRALPTSLVAKDGSRGALLVVYNEANQEIELSVDGDVSLVIKVPPGYSHHLVKLKQSKTIRARAADGEEFNLGVKFGPPKPFAVYLVPTVHTDWGYTGVQEQVAKIHKKNTELGLQISREGSKWVAEVIKQMVDHENDPQILDENRKGNFGIGAFPLNVLTGLCNDEELIRLFYEAGEMMRKGYLIYSATLNDVPSAVWALPSVLSGFGIKYYVQASNPDRGPIHAKASIRSPFYWIGPDGQKILAWFSGGYDGLLFRFNGYHQGLSAGFLSDSNQAAAGLALFTYQYESRGYPYEEIMMYGMFVDNTEINDKYVKIAKEYSQEWENPKLLLATTEEFFKEFEKKYSSVVPEISGDFGSYWEDGAASSAKELGISLEAKRMLAAYECLVAIGKIDEEKNLGDECWKDIIFWDEHTWGDAKSVSQPGLEIVKQQWDVKSAFAIRPWQRLKAALGEGFLFNPYPYPVSFYEDGSYYFLQPFSSEPYIRSELEPSEFNGIIEDEHYRIELDGGLIKRVFDKDLSVAIFELTDYGLDECVYVKGGKGTTLERTIGNYSDFGTVKEPVEGVDYFLNREGKTQVKGYEEGNGIKRLKLEATAGPITVEKTIELRSKTKELYFKNYVKKPEIYDKEAVYFAFPFNLNNPEVLIQEPGAFVDINEELAPGACAGWFSTSGVILERGSIGQLLDRKQVSVLFKSYSAPLITVGDINRGKWPVKVERTGKFFSYVMDNYWHTNYKASQGDAEFSYSITSSGYAEPSSAVKRFSSGIPIGISVKNPGFAVEGNVVITAVKKWRLGEGIVIRVLEVDGKPQRIRIKVPGGKVYRSNLLEEIQENDSIDGQEIQVNPRSFATFVLKGQK
ncbi:MAG: glycosyl hydrolase-related protein [Thermoprotei archaeon]